MKIFNPIVPASLPPLYMRKVRLRKKFKPLILNHTGRPHSIRRGLISLHLDISYVF